MFSFAGKRQLAALIGQLRGISRRTIDECPQTAAEQRNLNELATAVEVEAHLFDPQPSENRNKSENRDKSVPTTTPLRRRTLPRKPSPDPTIGYTKLGLNDSRLGALILAAKSRKARNQKQQLLIEGRRLICDAFRAGLRLETLLFAQKQHLVEFEADVAATASSSSSAVPFQIVRVPQQDLRTWSTLTTCPGTIAIFQRPENRAPFDQERPAKSGVTVICDNIREPNNLGSIIRTCAAVPDVRVVVTKGCCDPWDTKALRGGCGAQFHVPIDDDVTWERVERAFQPPDNNTPTTSIYLADNNLTTARRLNLPIRTYTELQLDDDSIGHCVLVIGGETHGISDHAYRLSARCSEKSGAGGCLHIPMEPNVNSLNTASALTLLLFEIRRKFPARRDPSVC